MFTKNIPKTSFIPQIHCPSHIFQIFLRVTVQNQIRIVQRVVVDEVVQFGLLRYAHVQFILDPGAVNEDFLPSRSSSSTHPVSVLNLQAISSYFIIASSKSCYHLTVYDKVSEFCAVQGSPRCCTRRKQKTEPFSNWKEVRLFVFGGRGWIRTTEALRSRFTVCPHWPLGNTPIFCCCGCVRSFVPHNACLL